LNDLKGYVLPLIMRSSLYDLLPPPTRRALAKLGQDVATARRKRNFTIAMMVERMGVATNTYRRVEKGDPTVAMGAYAMALFVLGLGTALGELVDPKADEVGLQLDEARLPKRVRVKPSPTPL
jgi:transcriptional regulator with XRE-family HTH domain